MRFIALDRHFVTGYRRGERGQTIILVAVSLISLLAMAALAIDVVTLYNARSEIQRAADAAALAAAKGIADSGITTLSTTDLTTNNPAVQTLATNMAIANANAALASSNYVGGVPVPSASISVSFCTTAGVCSSSISATTPLNSWLVKVALQQSNLPTFFARIWGRTAATATASAAAEAYNPGNTPSAATFTPVTPRCVKPWLVANLDPTSALGTTKFVSPTGVIEDGVVGKSFYITPNCGSTAGLCSPTYPPWTTTTGAGTELYYVPAAVSFTTTNYVCPTSCSPASDYEASIECCDVNSYAYLNCGGGSSKINWKTDENPQVSGDSANGAQCLIHSIVVGPDPGHTNGQDWIDQSLWPGRPMKITAGSGPQLGNLVSTSTSITTIPIFDPTTFSSSVTIVGYLQAFVNYVSDGSDGSKAGDIYISIINAVGCGTNFNASNPIVGGNGTSPIPVRLITPPTP